MPTYRSQILFQFGARGWSEVFFVNKSSHGNAMSTLQLVAEQRVKLLGAGAQIIALRVSDEEIPGDSDVDETGFQPPTANPVSDNPANTWYAQLRSGFLYRRQIHLRGMPDAWLRLTENGKGILDGSLNSHFNSFKTTLVANSYQMRVVLKGGLADTGVNVAGIDADADGFLTINAAGLTLTPQDRVKMKGWTGPDKSFLNRTFAVKSYIGAIITTTTKVPEDFDFGAHTGGKAYPRVKGWVQITDGSLKRPATRRTGRAFFVPAGRRPNQV